MNKEQKIDKIKNGFVGDIFGDGTVKHKIINKITKEESHLQWVGGCFGCYLENTKLSVYDILNDDNLTVILDKAR
jgi:hypothetical protein